ncbi:MAG: sigma-54-dependent Fis family transcriptional regulator [Myxococcales bacterium]|nr:sigma-54-dependent Fis family transcriptional regulator [Myxococcales bacterium]
MPLASVLIVDDEKNILSALGRALRIEDFEVDVAGSAPIALEKAAKRAYDVMLLDVQMPEMTGIEMLKRLREGGNDVPVIVMSGHGTIETAVEATRLGAHDFIEKPIGTDRLLLSLSHCLDLRRLENENQELRERTGATDELLGQSPAMQALRARIALGARAQAPVLITGERGTGKELVARAIHLASNRAKGPYEKVNSAAVPSELIESELFGHEAGAFTGATKQRPGKFERADTGTLFLDEVGDMPSAMQAKLLRVLQESEIERVGGHETVKVDVRVVAATNKDLAVEIDEGRFRADLFDRLNVLPLRVPPLRERREDVRQLATEFVARACRVNDQPSKTLDDDTLRLLEGYGYPGNVRELRNLIERLVILTPGERLTAADARALLPLGGEAATDALGYTPGVPLREMLESIERRLIEQALDHHHGHITNTAADLGLERSHLYKKMRSLGIRRKDD